MIYRRVCVWLAGAAVALGLGARARAADAGDEAALAREARLDVMLRVALAHNPEVLESDDRARAAGARADAAGRLPDLELKYEQWQVPLRMPLDLSQAGMLMLGLRQTFPALGTLAARERMARADVAGAEAGGRARRRDLVADVRRTAADYARADQEYRVHLEHAGLLSHLVEVTRAHYQAGQGTQQDLLRLMVELARLHTDVSTLEQERRSAVARLNTLMGRAPDAPLGPAPVLAAAPAASPPAVAADDGALDARRPELAAATQNVRRSEAAVDLARSSARWPSLMVGADYWYMPTAEMKNAYGAMVAINLPWLNPGRHAQVREAEHTASAERRALEAQRNLARYELRDAAARAEAARGTLAIIDSDVLPAARRSWESAQAAYQTGQGSVHTVIDAFRSYLEVRIQRDRAAAEVMGRQADYDRAAGIEPEALLANGSGR